jgi:hypothetical protein
MKRNNNRRSHIRRFNLRLNHTFRERYIGSRRAYELRRNQFSPEISASSHNRIVLLKLSLVGDERPPYLKIANEVHMYPSEVYTSVKRARVSQLLQGPEMHDRLNRSALLEFLVHGIRYAFPAEKGSLTRGIPTRYGASPLNEHIVLPVRSSMMEIEAPA